MFSMRMKGRTGRQGSVLRFALLVALFGCLQVPAVQASPRPAPDAAVVRCEPTSVVGQVGDVLTVDLYVEGVSDLYGADLRLTFDTLIADVVDEDAGLTGVQILPLSGFLLPSFVLSKVADNAAGTIQYITTQFTPTPPANGSGSVAASPAGANLRHRKHDVHNPRAGKARRLLDSQFSPGLHHYLRVPNCRDPGRIHGDAARE